MSPRARGVVAALAPTPTLPRERGREKITEACRVLRCGRRPGEFGEERSTFHRGPVGDVCCDLAIEMLSPACGGRWPAGRKGGVIRRLAPTPTLLRERGREQIGEVCSVFRRERAKRIRARTTYFALRFPRLRGKLPGGLMGGNVAADAGVRP